MAYRARVFRIALLAPLLLGTLPSFHMPQHLRASSGTTRAPGVMPFGPQVLAPPPDDEERARLLNAAIPFAGELGPAAAPFVANGDEASRQRAIDCLAAAMWYEAGADAGDQRAVGQVVLNRVRNPAFPSTVCGTVFEGASLATGCQFTFTCDRSMLHRRPSEAQLAEARKLAGAMLAGETDLRVGLATHYHTDWVHPAWSGSMLKLARVGTHLFFRWKGSAGQALARRQAYSASEPAIQALAALSPMHAGDDRLARVDTPAVLEPASLDIGQAVTARAAPRADDRQLHLTVSPADGAAAPALAALDLCAGRSFCKVLGTSADGGDVVFVYVRDRRTGVERTIWDCARFSRRNPEQCLGPATQRWVDFEGSLTASPSV